MRAAATVVLPSPGGEFVVVRRGEEFHEWAEVTNPHAIAEGADEADTDTDTGGEAEADTGGEADTGDEADTDTGDEAGTDTGGEAEADTDKDETAAKRAPAKRTARAAKTASDD